ncbi:hypothetical protein PG990_007574 [Apiospora arundinis]
MAEVIGAVGLGFGAASLAFDVLDKSVQLFHFLTTAVQMPASCAKFRLQLILYHNRVIAWGQSAKLVGSESSSGVSPVLGTQPMHTLEVVSRIGHLLEEFRDLNSRYNELHPTNYPAKVLELEQKTREFDVEKEVSQLVLEYEKSKPKRSYLRRAKHVIEAISSKGKDMVDVAKHPKRLWWALVDEDTFKALLEDLDVCVVHLESTLQRHESSILQNTIASVHRELIQSRGNQVDMKDMIQALASMLNMDSNMRRPNAKPREIATEYSSFMRLVNLKRISHLSDPSITPLDRNSNLNDMFKHATDFTDIMFDVIELIDEEDRPRPRALLTSKGGSRKPIWLEWKDIGDIPQDSKSYNRTRLRTAVLAEMLAYSHAQEPPDMGEGNHIDGDGFSEVGCLDGLLYTPKCIGYYDDHKLSGTRRFAWVFEMPVGCTHESQIQTLHEIMTKSRNIPALGDRTALASKLTTSLLYLHTVDWLHKGVHSDNVIFHSNDTEYNINKPYLAGYEYSRPEQAGTTSRTMDSKWDIYRWHRVQQSFPTDKNSRKVFDIYSLGLVLLEIAHWRPLKELLCLEEFQDVPAGKARNVRGWLLETTPDPPFKENPLENLRHTVGAKYYDVVKRCIQVFGEAGLGLDEKDNASKNVKLGMRLQQNYTVRVVDPLKSIKV